VTWRWVSAIVMMLCMGGASAQGGGLAVTYGAHGLQRLAYNSVILEDLDRYPKDVFRIWHMKATDSGGKVLTTGQYGWGENNNGRSWDAKSHAWLYMFSWGSIRTEYRQTGDTLDVIVTTANKSDSAIEFDGATVYPLVLHLPVGAREFSGGDGAHLADNVTAPSVTTAEFGRGAVFAVVGNASRSLYSGFLSEADGRVLTTIVSGTTPDAVGPDQPRRDRSLKPGEKDSFTMSLRFGDAHADLAGDVYKGWATQWPAKLSWADRRIIGTVYLGSSPQGDSERAAGFPNNPRRYFSDGNMDLKTPDGIGHFQGRILRQAQQTVTNLKRLHAQGMIVWDIEGEEYPQSTTYVCAPDEIGAVAPEMESVIKGSRYAGMKLVDAYFKIIHDAGFRVGVCVRPQHFTLQGEGRATQVTLPAAKVAEELIRKMRYAHDRWGATIFYVDSSVDAHGVTLDPTIMETAAAAMPDSLLIPEESTLRMYRTMAPFMTFLFHGDVATDKNIYSMYPQAFGVNMVNDVDPGKLMEHRGELVESVRRGDILMVHAGYWNVNNATALDIYREAGR
jgi:hypothetical protein